jgi:hypothetical protein
MADTMTSQNIDFFSGTFFILNIRFFWVVTVNSESIILSVS